MLNCLVFGMAIVFGLTEHIADALKTVRGNCLTQEELKKVYSIF